MKQVITTILALFLLFTVANAQNTKPSKETIKDFSVSFYYKYKFERNQSLQASAYLAGNRIGYSFVDIQVAVEKMETDGRFREELLKVMLDLYKAEEFFTLNLISIGMKATNAKELARYIYQKYERRSEIIENTDKINEPKDSTIDPRKSKLPKAKFTPPTQKDSISKRLFSGTRSFCDVERIWQYEVTIKGDSITLKLFPGSANSSFKNKSKPRETINGIVVNGKIVTKDSPEYLNNRFKYENGILYEVNNEGDYNDYPECK
ncbi:MAG: hypothetical protein J0L56_01735 [Chitinophagales bacterium]|nr:hypothetical protein [Chitinophagales bacterium]